MHISFYISFQEQKNDIPIFFRFIQRYALRTIMALIDELRTHIDIFQCLTKALVKPSRSNALGQAVSLLNVLGSVSIKKVVNESRAVSKPTINRISVPIEAVKGIGKKIGIKMRENGICTVEQLRNCDPRSFKIAGISVNRIVSWQESV